MYNDIQIGEPIDIPDAEPFNFHTKGVVVNFEVPPLSEPLNNFDAAVHTVEHLLQLAGVTVVGMTSEDIGGTYRSKPQLKMDGGPSEATIFIYDDSGDGESGVTEAIYQKIEETFRRAFDMVSHCIGNCKEEEGCSKCTFLIRQCSQWNENLNKPDAIKILDEIIHSFDK